MRTRVPCVSVAHQGARDHRLREAGPGAGKFVWEAAGLQNSVARYSQMVSVHEKSAHYTRKPTNISTSVPLTGCYWENAQLLRDQADAKSPDTGLCHWKWGDSTRELLVWFTSGKVLSSEVWDGNRAAFHTQRGVKPSGRSADVCNWNKRSYKLARLIWKPQHLKHRRLSTPSQVLLPALLPRLLTPQACVAQPRDRNTCVWCCSILSRRDSREKCSVCGETERHHSSSPWEQQRAADRTRTSFSMRVFPRVHAKNRRRDPIFPAP